MLTVPLLYATWNNLNYKLNSGDQMITIVRLFQLTSSQQWHRDFLLFRRPRPYSLELFPNNSYNLINPFIWVHICHVAHYVIQSLKVRLLCVRVANSLQILPTVSISALMSHLSSLDLQAISAFLNQSEGDGEGRLQTTMKELGN